MISKLQMLYRGLLILAMGLSAQSGVSQTPSATGTRSVSTDAHVLRKGDIISYYIHQDPSAGTHGPVKLDVTDIGSLRFPITHDPDYKGLFVNVNVANKSIAQVKSEVRMELLKTYYNNMDVDIYLENKAERLGKIVIFDRKNAIINTTLEIDLSQDVRLSEALAKVSSSFRNPEWVDTAKVRLIRPNLVTGSSEILELNWLKALSNSNAQDNPVLRDGDRIQVKEVGTGF